MINARRGRLAILAITATLSLSACSQGQTAEVDRPVDESPAASAVAPPDPSEATADPNAATAGAQDTGATETSDPTIEPAQPQTVELEESIARSAESESFTLTTHRVMVHDYYIEAEITLLNDGDSVLSAWFGSANSGPQLFDDRGRTYPFQVQAGGDKQVLKLQSGEGLDAVLVFAGRLDPDARALTLDFSEVSADTWSQVTFEIPLRGVR